MYMKDWISKLDGFLELNEKEILDGSGNVSRGEMEKIVREQLEKYNRGLIENKKPAKKS
jgi:hypothetical protein